MTNALVYSASTVSFANSDSSINDSAAGLANFIVGTQFIVSGSVANDLTFTVVSVSASKLVVKESVVTGAAGPVVTMKVTTPLPYVCREISTVLSALPNIESFPVNPPELINVASAALVFPEEGTFDVNSMGNRKGLHNIAIYMLRRKIDLATDISVIKPFVDLIALALLAQVTPTANRFNNSISTFQDVYYKYEFINYGGVDFVAYHFVMRQVKLLVDN